MVSAVVIVITTLLFSVFFSGMGVAFTAFNKLITFLGSEDRENDLYERFYKQNKSTIS